MMLKRLIRPGCAVAALIAVASATSSVSATLALRAGRSSYPAVEQVIDRPHVRHHRRGLQQQSDPRYESEVPTGGGDYGGPDSAFPVGENSAVRPGGSHAITAPIGSPAYTIQRNQQDRFCRDNPEVC